MEGQKTKQVSWHPSEGDLVSYLDRHLGWAFSLRVSIHLRRCLGCARRRTAIEKHLGTLSVTASAQELSYIRSNLMQAIRAYEQAEPTLAFQPTPEMRKTLEEYLGCRMAEQFAQPAGNAPGSCTPYQNVDRTLRLLLGGKAAASLKAKLLQEQAR